MNFGSITTGIIADGLVFNMDAANRASYPKTGTTATDTVGNVTGTLTNGTTFSNNNEGIFDFDGTDDYIDYGDPDSLSFGDSSSDGPFSISTWWNMDDYENFRGVQKFDSTSNCEYRINTLNSGLFKFNLYDNTNSNYIGLVSDSNFSSYQDNWINVVGTYNGSSTSNGCIVYVNGLVLATSTDAGGSYTAMHNTTSPFKLGKLTTGHANGKIANTQVYNRALSANEVLHNYNALKTRFGL